MRKLLILDWDPHYRQYVLEASQGLEAEAHLVMRQMPDPLPVGVAQVYVLPGLYDEPLQWVVPLADYARQHSINAVFTHEDELMELGAALSEELGLPGPSLAATRLCMSKWLTRESLLAAGIPGPRYRRVTTLAEACMALDTLTFPVVMKPVAASGGQGATKLISPNEVSQAWNWAIEPYRYLPSAYHQVIIEEFLEGPLVSVEAAVVDGEPQIITATDALQTIEPISPTQSRFVYHGLIVPTRLPENVYADLAYWTRKAILALGIKGGIVHTEFKITPQGVRIIEVNPRLPGVLIPELVRRALGVDLAKAALLLALGERPDITVRRHGGACVRLLLAHEDGCIRSIQGTEQTNSNPHMVRTTIFVKPGDRVTPPQQGDIETRLGYILTEHDTPHQALQTAEEVLARLVVEIEPPDVVSAT